MWTDEIKRIFSLPSQSACSARAHQAALSCSFPPFILFHQQISHNHFIRGGHKQDVPVGGAAGIFPGLLKIETSIHLPWDLPCRVQETLKEDMQWTVGAFVDEVDGLVVLGALSVFGIIHHHHLQTVVLVNISAHFKNNLIILVPLLSIA
jgi:hypothetical protein